MSTKPTKGKPLAQNRVQAARNGPRVPIFAVAVGALVAVIVIAVAVIALSGGDDDDAGGVTDAGAGAPIEDGGEAATLPAGQQAFGDVTIEGDELPEYVKGQEDDPAVGEPAPTLIGESPTGEPVTIDPADGPMVVAFLAHWCPHCQAEVPRIVDLASESPDGDTIEGVPFAAVLTGSDPTLDNFPPGEWLTNEGWPAPALLDNEPESGQIPDAFRAYGVSGFPFLVAIDADGNVAARSSGELGDEGLQEFFAQVAE
jgi:cytochrome c biogenesis protein CcmG/thiol:disulfide interchange protein DsbE